MPYKEEHLPFDLHRICKKLNISEKSMANCPISKEELRRIYEDYSDNLPKLEKIRTEILASLNEGLSGEVHSIRCRIKKPDHLIGKIIRGVYRNPKKYHLISVENYKKIITDFIGVRIIILDKRDWKSVHQNLLRIYRNIPERYVRRPEDIINNFDRYEEEVMSQDGGLACGYHAERPVAYIATEDDRKIYQDDFLKVDNSKAHYRSVHYIIRYKTVYFEIQVRTLFEEGWLEFDHRMKYPNDQHNKKKQEYIGILSSLAIAADRLISFYREEDFVRDSKEVEETEEASSYQERTVQEQTLEEKMKVLF